MDQEVIDDVAYKLAAMFKEVAVRYKGGPGSGPHPGGGRNTEKPLGKRLNPGAPGYDRQQQQARANGRARLRAQGHAVGMQGRMARNAGPFAGLKEETQYGDMVTGIKELLSQ